MRKIQGITLVFIVCLLAIGSADAGSRITTGNYQNQYGSDEYRSDRYPNHYRSDRYQNAYDEDDYLREQAYQENLEAQRVYNHTHGIVEAVQPVIVDGDVGLMNSMTVTTTGGLFNKLFGKAADPSGDSTEVHIDRMESHRDAQAVVVQLFDGRRVVGVRDNNERYRPGQRVNVTRWILETWQQ